MWLNGQFHTDWKTRKGETKNAVGGRRTAGGQCLALRMLTACWFDRRADVRKMRKTEFDVT